LFVSYLATYFLIDVDIDVESRRGRGPRFANYYVRQCPYSALD